MLLVKKLKKQKNILWNAKRCRNFIPVSKSNREKQERKQKS
jgi:hypothetical protein